MAVESEKHEDGLDNDGAVGEGATWMKVVHVPKK